MIPTNNKLLVESDITQKESYYLNGIEVVGANKFNPNYREKGSVIAKVKFDYENFSSGDVCIVHHNAIYSKSPYKVGDGLFSLPCNGNIFFGKLDYYGHLIPLFGNLIIEKVDEEWSLPLPPSERKKYIDRAIVVDAGYTPYKKGQFIFHRPHSGYDIHYVFGGELKVVTKIHEENIFAYLKNG